MKQVSNQARLLTLDLFFNVFKVARCAINLLNRNSQIRQHNVIINP